jgi:hypothetical protein
MFPALGKHLELEGIYTSSRIRYVVESTRIERTEPGKGFHPHVNMLVACSLDPALIHQELWTVWIHIKVGLDRSSSDCRVFEHEHEALSFQNRHPIGMELQSTDLPFPIDFMHFFDKGFMSPCLAFAAGGDPNFGLIFDCLCFSGVIEERDYKVSKNVLDWAGPDRVSWAKAMEPENWECLVELEYCTYHFPKSSLAYMAAQFQFNYYILKDDYSAGYLMRGIEMILGGAETVAEKVLAARKNAGDAGSKASQTAKNERLSRFMTEIEKLSDLVGRMAEKAILDQAFQNAITVDKSLWRQGRGQQAEYETVLRSEPEFRTRYYQVFNQTA